VGNLLPKLMGWVTVIVVLALAPTIATNNSAITTAISTANATLFIGMSVVVPFGGPLMIIALLFTGGLMATGRVGDGSVGAMLKIVGEVIVSIVVLSLYASAVPYLRTLILAGSGTFAQTIYGIIPIVLYLGVVAGAGVATGVSYIRGKRKKGKKSAAAFM
jgi:hypothetical protein